MNNIVYYPQKSIISGKPQIYVSGCEDNSENFNHIYENILSLCPYTIIWVKKNNGTIYSEEYKTFLEKINLVVLHISNENLQDKDFLREIEYIFEQSIPMLPILDKGVYIQKYEEIFGNKQYISEYYDEKTALPFKDKLKKYLDSVILQDTLITKIQNVFRANIFLSYRKKDRAQANKVIKSIHENEGLRDVSIWYDEFLIPGENYNDQIRTSLLDCDLFLLVITPNILEPDNYVMVHEYPDAYLQKKIIVPIETIPTEKDKLSYCYLDIPDILNVEESVVIQKKLLELLSYKQIISDNTGERDYLLGMAYFNGIGVEKNYQYALSYFSDSASKGYNEAYLKIVSMYLNGEGIKRNIQKAIDWQLKYSIKIGEVEGGTSKTFIECCFQLGDMTTEYYESVDTPIYFVKKSQNEEEEKTERAKEDKIEEETRNSRMKILDRAKKYYDDVIKLLEYYYNEDPLFYFENMAKYYQRCFNLVYSKNYNSSYTDMINYANEENKYRYGVIKYINEYLNQEADTESQIALAASLMRLGDALISEYYTKIFMKQKIDDTLKSKEEEAIQKYLKAGMILIKFEKIDDSIRTKKLASKAYSFLASSILRNFESIENAEDNFVFYADENIRLMETIYLQTHFPKDARSLADAYYIRGSFNNFDGKSIVYLEKSIKLLENAFNEIKRTVGINNSNMGFQFDLIRYKNILNQLSSKDIN